MMHEVTVVPVAEDHVERAGSALARAFQDEPFLEALLPDPAERTRRAPGFFVQGLRYARLVGAAIVPASAPVAAAFGWPIPTTDPAPEQAEAAGLLPFSETLGEAAYARFAALATPIEAAQQQLIPPPCWYLAALGVEPSAQGQGIGRALVGAFRNQAAQDGVPLALWTNTEANVAFYQALGLEVVGEGRVPGSALPYWILRGNPA